LNRTIPPRIEIDGEVDGREAVEKWLSQKRGTNVTLVIPQKGEQLKLITMCKNNATQKLLEKFMSSEKTKNALEELSLMLGLKKIPAYIEAYDISHTGGSDNVAGMVVFKDGKPFKKAYRRFSVKGFSGQDDYASMEEVLRRRFTEYLSNKDKNEEYGFGRMPDLILLDGGKGQVNAVLPLLKEFNLDIPLFGMVKDNKHRTSAISTGGGRIEFNSKRKAFSLVTQIQDEVHRFSVEYHRKKHTKSALENSLTKISGIGEKKAKMLIVKFRTIDNIRNASVEELEKVQGISKVNAEEIYKTFHGE
jgi:excinuclease ABC subunit C